MPSAIMVRIKEMTGSLWRYSGWFNRYWRQKRWGMAGIFLLSVLGVGVRTVYPVLLKYITDQLTGHFVIDSVHRLVIAFFGVGMLNELLAHALPATRAAMNVSLAARVRNHYYNLFTRKVPGFHLKFHTGDLLTRLTDDIDGQWDRIAWYSCSGVFRPVEALLVLGFSLVIMFWYSWQLTLLCFIPLPFLVLVLAKTEDRMIRYTDAKQRAASQCNDVLEACFAGIRVVKTTLSEEDQARRYQQALDNRLRREKSFIRINQIIQFFSMLVNNAGTVIVIFAGGIFVIHNHITIGTLLLFTSYMQQMIGPIWTLSWFYASSRQVFRYVDRLEETRLTGEPDPRLDCNTDPGAFSSLHLQDVDFGYTPERNVLQGINLDIKKGETLAVVGRVGCGKTTLLELLAGNLHPQKGGVFFNNLPMTELDVQKSSGRIGYVLQESILFSESVRDNLTLGDDLDQELIDNALEQALVKSEIERFPQGLGTVLGQRGLSLSGGQKQRVSLARTLARKPELLLLDDCTAAMDARTEREFWQRLRRQYPELTAVVVTHRTATARRADRIIVLDNGHIREQGSHEQLLAAGGFYKKLMVEMDAAEEGEET